MKLSEFNYHLPSHLIARQPAPQRSASRLMVVNCSSGAIGHQQFTALPDLLRANDLLVFNDTRVIPARLFGRKASGGRVEVLLERVLGEGRVLAQLRVSKKPAVGSKLLFDWPARPRLQTGKQPVADEKSLVQAKQLAGKQPLANEKFLVQAKQLAGKQPVADEKSLVQAKQLAGKQAVANEKSLVQAKQLAGKQLVADEKSLVQAKQLAGKAALSPYNAPGSTSARQGRGVFSGCSSPLSRRWSRCFAPSVIPHCPLTLTGPSQPRTETATKPCTPARMGP